MYAECHLEAGAHLTLPTTVEERGTYVVSGTLQAEGQRFGPHTLIVFQPGTEVVVTADTPTCFMLVGGAPLDGPRHLWWNFVSSSQERIEAAKADWRAGRFPPVPGDAEFILLPD